MYTSHSLNEFIAVHECRDRALENQGDFVGLAGMEHQDGVEYHALDDVREGEERIKLVGPRFDASSGSRPVTTYPSY